MDKLNLDIANSLNCGNFLKGNSSIGHFCSYIILQLVAFDLYISLSTFSLLVYNNKFVYII
jgi:hypothetical protein